MKSNTLPLFAFAGVLCVASAGLAEKNPSVPKPSWSESQATGKPDTPGAGDIETAWASATPDGDDEWLELEYAAEIEPVEVHVHETFNPGAVYQVSGFTSSGMEAPLWKGTDPTPRTAARGVSEIPIDSKLKTKRIRIYLDSKEVAGWNEIDAVGLKDADGKMHWAVKATASSTYGRSAAVASALVGTVSPRIIVMREPEVTTLDPRDERIDVLEKEVTELKKIVAELQKKLREIDK